MKLLYKPFGIVLGIVAGILSRRVFDVLWGKIDPDGEEPPKPKTRDVSAAKAIGAAALQAAVFKGVRAGVDRAGARAFEKTTGVWPGDKKPEPADD